VRFFRVSSQHAADYLTAAKSFHQNQADTTAVTIADATARAE
jgi:hypothetical protein